MIYLELPIPPTINHYYQNNGRGGRRLSLEAQVFRRDVYYLYISNKNRVALLEQKPLQIKIKFVFDNNRANDIDNRIKPLLDALQQAGCFLDDKYFYKMVVEKEINKSLKNSVCLVEIDYLK